VRVGKKSKLEEPTKGQKKKKKKNRYKNAPKELRGSPTNRKKTHTNLSGNGPGALKTQPRGAGLKTSTLNLENEILAGGKGRDEGEMEIGKRYSEANIRSIGISEAFFRRVTV